MVRLKLGKKTTRKLKKGEEEKFKRKVEEQKRITEKSKSRKSRSSGGKSGDRLKLGKTTTRRIGSREQEEIDRKVDVQKKITEARKDPTSVQSVIEKLGFKDIKKLNAQQSREVFEERQRLLAEQNKKETERATNIAVGRQNSRRITPEEREVFNRKLENQRRITESNTRKMSSSERRREKEETDSERDNLRSIQSQIERQKQIENPVLRALTSTKSTETLATILGTLLGGSLVVGGVKTIGRRVGSKQAARKAANIARRGGIGKSAKLGAGKPISKTKEFSTTFQAGNKELQAINKELADMSPKEIKKLFKLGRNFKISKTLNLKSGATSIRATEVGGRGISKARVAKGAGAIGLTTMGASGIAQWLAADNISTGTTFSMNQLIESVKNGTITREQAELEAEELKSMLDSATKFTRINSAYNPLLLPFRSVYLINARKAEQDYHRKLREIQNTVSDEEKFDEIALRNREREEEEREEDTRFYEKIAKENREREKEEREEDEAFYDKIARDRRREKEREREEKSKEDAEESLFFEAIRQRNKGRKLTREQIRILEERGLSTD